MTRSVTAMDGEFTSCIRSSRCITNCSCVHNESEEQTTDYIPASRQGAKLRSRYREI